MRTSDEGILAILTHEGIVPGPYRDSVGVWTYGVGHTAAAGGLDPADLPRGMPKDLDAELRNVMSVFRRDLAKFEERVNRAFKVPLTQHQFDAALSFDFNTGGILRASWVDLFNKGDKVGAAKRIMSWSRPPEIIERRKSEQALFRTGVYPATNIPVWHVDGSGNVIWRRARMIGRTDALALLGRGYEGKTPTGRDAAKNGGAVASVGALLAAGGGAAYAFACKIPLLSIFFQSCGG